MMAFNNCYVFSIFLIAITSVYRVYAVDGFVFDSEKYPPEPICKKLNVTVYQSHYTIVQLRCQWRPFLNYMKNKIELETKESASRTILDKKTDETVKVEKKNTLFDIEFENIRQEAVPGVSVSEISDDLFSLFRLQKLTARSLKLSSISFNAFSKCCENLEVLDLSKNSLRRIDSETLKPLKNLRVLQLSENQLQVENNNFQHNKILEEIFLDGNGIQYLPEKLFNGNERLKTIDLVNNGFRKLDACMLSSLKSFSADANFVKGTVLYAKANPVDCDCDVFYLANLPKLRLEIVCDRPDYYHNRFIGDLSNEKPDNVKCSFEAIRKRCNPEESSSNVAVIVLSVFLGVFVLLTFLACCQIANLSGILSRNRNRSASVAHPNQNAPPAVYKVLSTVDHKE